MKIKQTNPNYYAKVVISAIILWAFLYFVAFIIGKSYYNFGH
ncbi:hypothetical protein OIU83_22570 [Flavobacterium sp. LS1R49]|uniref:Uncharacterized protein n=1 Tax=Flavobacterium shii TaxID=2987687 RepID=A0A9X3C6Z8_9FLAO|nr:hypothetical protein [Flavobacterium shii]MCV9930462.1 hypothetical protein [Flavobacterium shii]